MGAMTLEFNRTEHPPHPVSENRRAEILSAPPGFGQYFTDNMVMIDYDKDQAGTTRRYGRTGRSRSIPRRWCSTTARRSSKA